MSGRLPCQVRPGCPAPCARPYHPWYATPKCDTFRQNTPLTVMTVSHGLLRFWEFLTVPGGLNYSQPVRVLCTVPRDARKPRDSLARRAVVGSNRPIHNVQEHSLLFSTRHGPRKGPLAQRPNNYWGDSPGDIFGGCQQSRFRPTGNRAVVSGFQTMGFVNFVGSHSGA